MLPLIAGRRAEVAELCRRFHVLRLDVFGSAARGADFDPERSDVDLFVTHDPAAPALGVRGYLALRDQLAAIPGRPVDLVMAGAVRNRFVRAEIERSKQTVYAA